MTTIYSTVNSSPTRSEVVGAGISNANLAALALTADGSGKMVLPGAGQQIFGLAVASEDEVFNAGDSITVQNGDCGEWIAGGSFAKGDFLTADSAGKCVKAAAGDFLAAVALDTCGAAGTWVHVKLLLAGNYNPQAGGLTLTARKTSGAETAIQNNNAAVTLAMQGNELTISGALGSLTTSTGESPNHKYVGLLLDTQMATIVGMNWNGADLTSTEATAATTAGGVAGEILYLVNCDAEATFKPVLKKLGINDTVLTVKIIDTSE